MSAVAGALPIAELYRRFFALWAAYENPAKPEEECEEDWDALEKEWGQTISDIDGALEVARPTTPGEAVALLLVARKELTNMHSDNEGNVDSDARLLVNAIDGAVGILRLAAIEGRPHNRQLPISQGSGGPT